MTYDITQRTLHFREPAGTSRGTYTERRVWYVTLHEAGHSGTGECAPLPRLSCDDIPNYETVLNEFCQQVCQTGHLTADILPYPSMRFGLECALTMLYRQSHILFDTPFTQGKTGMPINGLIWMGTYEEMHRRLTEKIRAGFHCIKVKIGAIGWDKDMELLRQCASLLKLGHGDAEETTLRVDANGAFAPEEAPQRLEELARLGIHSIEQPIRQGQWTEMARLCRTSPLPIALDEELIGINDTEGKIRLLDTLRPQYIILKPSLHGGLSGCNEWIQLAEERGIGWWATSALESNVGLSAISQWVAQYSPSMAQGLGTGLLYTDNTPAETEVRGEEIFYRVTQVSHVMEVKGIKGVMRIKEVKEVKGVKEVKDDTFSL